MLVRVALVALALVAVSCASVESGAVLEQIPDGTEVADDEEATTADDEPSEAVESNAPGVDTEPEDQPVTTEAEAELFSELCEAELPPVGSRVEVTSSGNHIGEGSLDFATVDEMLVELPDNAVWVTADPSVPGGWYVVLERGSSVRVSVEGVVTAAVGDSPGLPPELSADGNPLSPFRHHDLFTDPLPDGRVVVEQSIAAALVQPTERNRHGALGDEIEAAGVEWVDTCTGEGQVIEVAETDVIEGISPLIADVDNDGQVELVVTLSNSTVGAWLAAYELDGTLVAESDPIGQGNRWRNQLGVGPFGPDGQIELISVRTPHIGGTVEAFRLVTTTAENGEEPGNPETISAFVPVAESPPGYTSHIIGETNLSLAIAVDANGDSIPDIITPTADRQRVVALTRTDELDGALQGWNIVGERPLNNELTGNIATQQVSPGTASLAIADGNILRIWR